MSLFFVTTRINFNFLSYYLNLLMLEKLSYLDLGFSVLFKSSSYKLMSRLSYCYSKLLDNLCSRVRVGDCH